MTARRPSPSPDEVSERLRRYQRSRDPGDLWPGLAERDRVAAARELERVARAVLTGESSVSIDPAGRHDPYALRIAGHTTGTGAVFGRWLEDARIDAADAVRQEFTDHLTHGRTRFARIESGAVAAVDAVLARGIRPTILKGLHTAHVYFDEPGMRRMSDADLLVSAGEVDGAEAALTSAGFRPESAPHRPYKRDWIANNAEDRVYSVEFSDARSKWGLELHASLDRVFLPGAVAKLDGERHRTWPFSLRGRMVDALAPEPLLVYIACHCSQELDGMRLMRVIEMVHVIRGSGVAAPVDWSSVLEIVRATGVARYTYPALSLVDALVPGLVDRRVLNLGHADSTRAARHTVARLAPAGGSMDRRGVARQMMWTRGPVAIADRVLRNLWPASLQRPEDVVTGWRVRLRRLRTGMLTLGAPDERH